LRNVNVANIYMENGESLKSILMWKIKWFVTHDVCEAKIRYKLSHKYKSDYTRTC